MNERIMMCRTLFDENGNNERARYFLKHADLLLVGILRGILPVSSKTVAPLWQESFVESYREGFSDVEFLLRRLSRPKV